MTTKHKRIRQRHVAVDFMAAGSGSFLVDFVTHHNWTSAVGAVLLGLGTYILDREGIENEETLSGEDN